MSPAGNSYTKYTLIIATAKTVAASFAFGILPRLLLTFFRFMQPLLLRRVTQFVVEPITEESTNEGWGLTAAYGLVYIGIAVSLSSHFPLYIAKILAVTVAPHTAVNLTLSAKY